MPNILSAYQKRDADFFKFAVNDDNISQYRMPMEKVKWADVVSLALYEWGQHKYFYDVEKLSDMLQRAGFVNVREVEFDPAFDLQSRVGHTFYLVAEKSR